MEVFIILKQHIGENPSSDFDLHIFKSKKDLADFHDRYYPEYRYATPTYESNGEWTYPLYVYKSKNEMDDMAFDWIEIGRKVVLPE